MRPSCPACRLHKLEQGDPRDPKIFFNSAMLAMDEKNFMAAEINFKKAVQVSGCGGEEEHVIKVSDMSGCEHEHWSVIKVIHIIGCKNGQEG